MIEKSVYEDYEINFSDTYTSDDGTVTASKVYNSSKKCYEWTITVNKLLKYKLL